MAVPDQDIGTINYYIIVLPHYLIAFLCKFAALKKTICLNT